MNLHRSVCMAMVLAVGLGHAAPSAAEDAYFFCQSSVTESHKVYLSGVFSASAQKDAVSNAWRARLAAIDPNAGPTGTCQGAAREYTEYHRQQTVGAMTRLKVSLVNVEWSYAAAPSAAKPAAPVAPAAAPASTPVQYGFCYEWRQSPAKSYVSATFEMPPESGLWIREIFGEFAKDTAQRYGVAVAELGVPGNGCSYQQGADRTEASRKSMIDMYAKQSAVETGWKFVRTAQTPQPTRPVDNTH